VEAVGKETVNVFSTVGAVQKKPAATPLLAMTAGTVKRN
jgi:hypothetical protein